MVVIQFFLEVQKHIVENSGIFKNLKLRKRHNFVIHVNEVELWAMYCNLVNTFLTLFLNFSKNVLVMNKSDVFL